MLYTHYFLYLNFFSVGCIVAWFNQRLDNNVSRFIIHYIIIIVIIIIIVDDRTKGKDTFENLYNIWRKKISWKKYSG